MEKPTTPYKYLCVLDFEATCDGRFGADGRPDRSFKSEVEHEIIEFPSVLLELDPVTHNYKYKCEYRNFCLPLEVPKLTYFCSRLTGITQHDVDGGLDFPDVLVGHYTWLQSHVGDMSNVAIVTCGFWDLGTMLPAECKRWAVLPPTTYTRFINIKNVFFDKCGSKLGMDRPKGMAGMLKVAGIPLEGRHHSGIDDCKNIAKLVQYVVENGVEFTSALERSIPLDDFTVKSPGKKKPFGQAYARAVRAVQREGGIVANQRLQGRKCGCGRDPTGYMYVEIDLFTAGGEKIRQFAILPACAGCLRRNHGV